MLTFKAHDQTIYGLAFSPDGRHLATSSKDEPVILWAFDGPTEVKRFPGSGSDSPVVFSPDGRFLARGGWDFALLEVSNGKVIATGRARETVAFSPDSKEVAGCSPLERWSLPKGKPLSGGWGDWRGRYAGGDMEYASGALAYSPDGTTIATAFFARLKKRESRPIVLWARKTGEERGRLLADFTNGDPRFLTYSPDGSLIAGVYGARVGGLDAATGATVAVLKVGTKHFKGIAFTPDGKRLITVNTDAAVRVYDTATWTETTGYEWDIGRLTAVAVAPDGLRAACGSDRGRVVVWDLDL